MNRFDSEQKDNTSRQQKMNCVLSVGVEPTTLGLLDPRSNQLSYESVITGFTIYILTIGTLYFLQ
jgi:hypothetical protein